jgi:dTDP-4-amino-4,6-dideoxygalactose transaminase
MAYMEEKNIVTSAVHARNDTHTMFKDFRANLPGVDEFVSEQVSIPVGWWLTEQQRDYIIEAVRQYRP